MAQTLWQESFPSPLRGVTAASPSKQRRGWAFSFHALPLLPQIGGH